jgi:formamidopyrimidine-DNA glycosylase
MDLSGGLTLVSHLRMEGKYRCRAISHGHDKHDAIIFEWNSGQALVYHDVRKFGSMELVETAALKQLKSIAQLGPDADEAESVLQALMANRSRQRTIKAILLDQTVVAGIGNIYADELLWAAKIHPETPMHQLSLGQCQTLAEETQRIMQAAMADGGSSINTYESLNGQQGRYQDKLKVYARYAQPCERCGMPLSKIKVAGRGTHYCAHCQPLIHE